MASIQNLPMCSGCLEVGGNDGCKIRPCTLKKMSDCNECDESTNCRDLEALWKVCPGAFGRGMLIKTGKGGQPRLKRKWTAEIRDKFLCSAIEI